jgi:Domain of unknown function (DUF932)
MKANLCLHCGAFAVERDALNRIKTPAETATFKPIAHRQLLERAISSVEEMGWKLVGEAHALTDGGDKYFGLLQVSPETAPDRAEHGFIIGLRNANNKRLAAGLTFGSVVFVCDNMAFSGTVTVFRKHTKNLHDDLPERVRKAVEALPNISNAIDQRFLDYQRTAMPEVKAHDIIIKALDKGVIGTHQIPVVLKEWRTPKHPEFAQDGKTAWRLFNAFTEAFKDTSIWTNARRGLQFQRLFDGETGLFMNN